MQSILKTPVRLIRLLAVICLVSGFAESGLADDGKCLVRDRNELVVVVICPAGLDQTGWRNAGATACGGRKPCGAWIWDDVTNAPKSAPPTPTQLTQKQIVSAVAVWVNETDKLITISPVKK